MQRYSVHVIMWLKHSVTIHFVSMRCDLGFLLSFPSLKWLRNVHLLSQQQRGCHLTPKMTVFLIDVVNAVVKSPSHVVSWVVSWESHVTGCFLCFPVSDGGGDDACACGMLLNLSAVLQVLVVLPEKIKENYLSHIVNSKPYHCRKDLTSHHMLTNWCCEILINKI